MALNIERRVLTYIERRTRDLRRKAGSDLHQGVQ